MKINVDIGPNKKNYYKSAERKAWRSEVCFLNNYYNKKKNTINMFYPLFIYKDKTVQKALKKLWFFFYSFTRKNLCNDEKITSSSLQKDVV